MLKTLVNGGDEEDRTPDLLNAIQTRSQLRHAPMLDIYLCLPACLFAVDSSSFLIMIGIQLFVGCRFYQFREIVKSAEIFCENPVCRFAEDCAFSDVKRPLECHSSALPAELYPHIALPLILGNLPTVILLPVASFIILQYNLTAVKHEV